MAICPDCGVDHDTQKDFEDFGVPEPDVEFHTLIDWVQIIRIGIAITALTIAILGLSGHLYGWGSWMGIIGVGVFISLIFQSPLYDAPTTSGFNAINEYMEEIERRRKLQYRTGRPNPDLIDFEEDDE